MKGKAVCLLSGGIDSATAFFIARAGGYECLPLAFDYGQRHMRELASAEAIARSARTHLMVLTLDFPWKGSSLLDRTAPIPAARSNDTPSTYVPGRNIIFLAHALSYAESVGASAVVIGAHSEDYSGYPDCRSEFFDAFRAVKNTGTRAGQTISLEVPLLKLGKADIIRWGRALGVPFELTWSCYSGGSEPCGACDSCYYRAKGFREAGLADPLLVSSNLTKVLR
ncbi:MAG: 7-cyano-7-deazaguanine synthase QueC [Candidatus Omnitrophica bacterium]|nr:7-cyano-7-deazaguanine synthase QueC [Candidatus Omnitrophota bacterium]